jgi:hypothetical protein
VVVNQRLTSSWVSNVSHLMRLAGHVAACLLLVGLVLSVPDQIPFLATGADEHEVVRIELEDARVKAAADLLEVAHRLWIRPLANLMFSPGSEFRRLASFPQTRRSRRVFAVLEA